MRLGAEQATHPGVAASCPARAGSPLLVTAGGVKSISQQHMLFVCVTLHTCFISSVSLCTWFSEGTRVSWPSRMGSWGQTRDVGAHEAAETTRVLSWGSGRDLVQQEQHNRDASRPVHRAAQHHATKCTRLCDLRGTGTIALTFPTRTDEVTETLILTMVSSLEP